MDAGSLVVSSARQEQEATAGPPRLGRGERGFTLIELMVVVLIIAILVAIALPGFLGMRNRGYEARAKSNLRNGVTTAQAYYSLHQAWTGMNAAELTLLDGGIPFADGPPAAGNIADTVYAGGVSASGYTLSVKSSNGVLFRCVVVNYGAPTYTKSTDSGASWQAW